MGYAVIVENEESQWADETGVLYHFPKRYLSILEPGTRVVYYKGKLKNHEFAHQRLSQEPHYFGVATVTGVYPDKASSKGDLFATIDDFQRFAAAVPIKHDAQYLEAIPKSRATNYWRDGVRAIDEETFELISHLAGVGLLQVKEPSGAAEPATSELAELESGHEGSKTLRYVTTYERDPRYRRQAIAIHGLRCKACGLHMGEVYGELGMGLIHVHHVVPVSQFEKPKKLDPANDLVPVCPSCHSVIHRKKSVTLTVDELKVALAKQRLHSQ